MVQGGGILKLLNYFHGDSSPYIKEFEAAERMPFEITREPEVGLPTPESNAPEGRWARLKREAWGKRQKTDYPH